MTERLSLTMVYVIYNLYLDIDINIVIFDDSGDNSLINSISFSIFVSTMSVS